MSLVVPAVLPSSRKDLDEKLTSVVAIHAVRRVQIDVVDGKFASPASWPFSVKDINGKSGELETMAENREMLPELDRIEYEIDLMCLDAEKVIGEWLSLGASRITLHAESSLDIDRLLKTYLQRYGYDCVSFGLALNIESDLSLIEPYVHMISYVQFMGIASIGKQEQAFDLRVFDKVRVFHTRHQEITIQVDGGVSLVNAKKLISLGVSDLVVGSAILRASDHAASFAEFEALYLSHSILRI